MDTIHTLSQLLTASDCQYAIYDLGRRINPISQAQFAEIEKGSAPYPYPLQRKANLAIVYWNEQKQPWIWFLKFELDERGLLKQADIGNFIKFVVEAMGTRLSQEMSEEQQQKLANNPYTFKPSEDKMAVFHSLVRAQLQLPTSQYYEHAQIYFQGKLGWENWQTVGLQGITDICARLDQEHVTLPEKLTARLIELTESEIAKPHPDLFLLSALIRALSGAKQAQVKPLMNTLLASPRLSHQEVLIGIAGRAWHWLAETEVAQLFLVRLAQTGNQNLFNQLFADLVMLPQLRMVLLPLLHSSPSPELANALLNLQQATKG
ncbi:DUF3549 family protein [Vibrio vulnificus]|nr:DUF3549 family protein [Vibrio vulnificus]